TIKRHTCGHHYQSRPFPENQQIEIKQNNTVWVLL
ncbi:MAG: muramoyltetrapeptide carboxypeptidase LdcA involved in peptidoglycan recycling, partial [Paracoccaceae bacterium]